MPHLSIVSNRIRRRPVSSFVGGTSIGGASFVPLTYLDSDGALAADSDSKIATQKAVKTYADSLLASSDAMTFKGAIDCSANPDYPAADRGDTYRVSVAGKIGGASGISVADRDLLICMTDSTASGTEAAVGSQWDIVQGKIGGSILVVSSIVTREAPSGTVDGTNAIFVLANTPTAGTECVFLQGILKNSGTDYTITGDTITFSTPPTIGDVILVNYLK